MVAGWAPGVLTILTSSLFQSTTITPELEPAAAAAAALLPPACCEANTTVVVASAKTTPAIAINDFFMLVPSPRCLVAGATVRAMGGSHAGRRRASLPGL